MPLEQYRSKRNPERTPEPFDAGSRQGPQGRMFVVQKHDASRLHYDFRLEMEGVLRSWAVPKGPSINPADKHLAVMVEDHPLDYANFEGVIPAGNYGAGSVIVWDRGDYRVIDPPGGDAAEAVRAGKLDIELHGFKLRGAFTMVRIRDRETRRSRDAGKQQWLLIKKRDGFATGGTEIVVNRPRSVLSGFGVDEIAHAPEIGGAIERELERIDAPELKAAREAKSFPLALARLASAPVEGDEWIFEIKYDGVRALAIRDGGAVRLWGRSGAEITRNYPETVLALDAAPFEKFVIDGEIFAPGPDGRPNFHLIQPRIHAGDSDRISRLALASPVIYEAFDLLSFGRFDLRPLDLETRKSFLARMIHDEGLVRYSGDHNGNGRAFYEAVRDAGLEGVIAKRRDSPYPKGRSGQWLKIKCPRRERFVIGGWTDPGGARANFGALLLGQYESPGVFRFVSRVGTGFDEAKLREIHRMLVVRRTIEPPFRSAKRGEPAPPRGAHFCAPELVCEVSFTEWTDDGGLRHPSFIEIAADTGPSKCIYDGPGAKSEANESDPAAPSEEPMAQKDSEDIGKRKRHSTSRASRANQASDAPAITLTHPDKVFWPAEGYTKRDLVEYYEAIAPLMMPYLKDRPVVLTRYPDGIDGKSFFQKDAPAFAPSWIRTEKIYSEDAQRNIAYFVLESAEAIAYVANLGSIPIHIWASRIGSLGSPDWLLFDIDPKGSTTAEAVRVARGVADVLRTVGMRPYLKTSGQDGLHVMVGLARGYTYEHARMFSELVATIVARRVPESATIERNVAARGGRVYIDYLQLGQGKTIAAPYSVRPRAGAPVSAPLRWDELRAGLDPAKFNIRTMFSRGRRLKRDPFLGVLDDPQRLEPAMPKLEAMLSETGGVIRARSSARSKRRQMRANR